MEFEKLMSIIENSSVDEWNVITCWGFGSGPSYKSKFDFYEVRDGIKSGTLVEESHGMYACYRPDVSISLAFGLLINDDFKEEWANAFPDKSASSHYVDIFFNNNLVERISYVNVDGGRAKLPIPKSINDLSVKKREYLIIKLIDNFESSERNFESYFNRANLRLV